MISTEGHRWNAPGVPTVYLAGDIGLTLVEAGRHLRDGADIEPRVIWAAWVETGGLVDLRDPGIGSALGLADGLWFLDRGHTLPVAESLRDIDGVAGLIVPSAGSPDDLTRTNVVLYADRLTMPVEAIVREPRALGSIAPVDAAS